MAQGSSVDGAYGITNTQNLAAPTTISVTTTTGASAQLADGRYEITCDEDCFYLQGGSAVAATTSSVPLWKKTYKYIFVENDNDYLAAIVSAGTATLSITKQ